MLKGLWAYLKTPMGFVVGIYGFLVVFWGAAIVLFLLGWIPTNSRNTQDIWIGVYFRTIRIMADAQKSRRKLSMVCSP